MSLTDWDSYGSLITLHIGADSDSSAYIPTSDCESDIYEELPENEDSATFCDSDSGIYSLYETIIKYQAVPATSSHRNSFVLPETITENDELDNKNLFLETLLQKLKVDPTLFHVFQRSYRTTHASDVFAMKFDVLSKIPVWNNHIVREQETTSEIKRALMRTVTRQQQVLRTMMTRMKAEKAAVDDSLQLLQDSLINMKHSKIVTKYNRFLDQMDSLVNLIFGIELKIANLSSSSKNAIQWNSRLEEAIMIKAMHDETFSIIMTNLDASNQCLLCDGLKLKQKLICEMRLVNQELHYLELQLKILFMYSVY